MSALGFREILEVPRSRPGRRGRTYMISDQDLDRIVDLAEAEFLDGRDRGATVRAIDVIERELAPFIVEPS